MGEFAFLHLFPMVRLLGFLPFLLLSLMRLSLPKALWASAAAGFALDLYTSQTPLGLYALNYSLTTLILFRYKKFFSEDKIFPLMLYAITFSSLSTLIHFCINPFPPSLLSLVTDLIFMPIADGIYTLTWVLLPLTLYKQLKPVVQRELSRITR